MIKDLFVNNYRRGTIRWPHTHGVVGLFRVGILFLLFAAAIANAQTVRTDSIAKFKVKYTTGDYRFFPADGYFFVGTKNKLRITNSRNARFEVKITNGKLMRSNDSMFVIDNLVNMGVTLVSIFEIDSKGKKKIVVNKPFTVVSFPKVRFGNIACDSAMPALMMTVDGLNVYYKDIRKKMPATGFKMEYYENGKFILDSSNTNRLTKKMLTYVSKLKPGSLVYLSDIKYKDPDGMEHKEPVYRVFIIPEEKNVKFGVD